MVGRRFLGLLIPTTALLAIVACSLTPRLAPTAVPAIGTMSATSPASPTVPPEAATPTVEPSSQPATSAPTSEPDYLDDRSTPQGVILSLYNAINRHEFVRAYSYWESNAQDLPSFPQFEQGYQNTASVQVTLGQVGGDAGAGQFYYTVPVVLGSESTSGTLQTYAGCYTLHLANPSVQGAPPFQPLAIRSGVLQVEDNGTDSGELLDHACEGLPTGPSPILSPQPTTPASGVDSSLYIDDRSSPRGVLRSLFNAINRHEYVRAYGYWEPGSPQLPGFGDFEQGYADTESVSLSMGEPTTDHAAGQTYYLLPATLTAQTSGGGMQYFVGCYQLHLGNPSIQGVPPFQPLAIQQAQVSDATNQADADSQLAQACVGLP
jgi:hypothetical protein